MTAEEYVVERLKSTEADLHAASVTVTDLRNLVNDLESQLQFVLSLIEEGLDSFNEPTYTMSIYKRYDSDKFDNLTKIMDGGVF